MGWRLPPQLLVRGVGVHAEVPPRLPLPPAQVSAQHRWFHLVRELGYPDLLTPSADLLRIENVYVITNHVPVKLD